MAQLSAQLPQLRTCALRGKRVVVRADMNVPIVDGEISNQRRIVESVPTLEYILKQGGSLIVLSHLGRPKDGEFEERFSLQPVARTLAETLHRPVRFVSEYLQGVEIKPGEAVLCENVRFNRGEKQNDVQLSKDLAALGDCFVMDAFGAAHRAHASTCGALQQAPQAAAGLLLMKEVQVVEKFMSSAKNPVGAIVGGAKISDKLAVLLALIKQVDWIFPGGGIANTLLASQGFSIGKSLCEKDMLGQASQVLESARKHKTSIFLPSHVVCSQSRQGEAVVKPVDTVAEDDMILDIATQSLNPVCQAISEARTILWNGPVGLFEERAFSEGTRKIAAAIAASDAYSIAGGGDTLSSIDQFGVQQGISYISTGGGALLSLIEGQPLPALQALVARGADQNTRANLQ